MPSVAAVPRVPAQQAGSPQSSLSEQGVGAGPQEGTCPSLVACVRSVRLALQPLLRASARLSGDVQCFTGWAQPVFSSCLCIS